MLLRLFDIISLRKAPFDKTLDFLISLHPILEDAVRLYLLLAMFAIFELDEFRGSLGFESHSRLVERYRAVLSKFGGSNNAM